MGLLLALGVGLFVFVLLILRLLGRNLTFSFFFSFGKRLKKIIAIMFREKASLIFIELCFRINFYLPKTLGQDKSGIYMVFATIRKFTAWDWSLVTPFKKMECCNANWWCDCLDLTHKGFQLKSLCLAQACETQLHQALPWAPLCEGSAPLWYLISP